MENKFFNKVLIVFAFAVLFVTLFPTLFQVGDNYTENNEYIVLYDLDYPFPSLNDNSLRDVFEDGLLNAPQLVANGDFSDGTNGWSGVSGQVSLNNGGYLDFNTSAGFSVNQSITILNNNKYFLNVDYKSDGIGRVNLRLRQDATTVSNILSVGTNTNWSYLSIILTTSSSGNQLAIVRETTSNNNASLDNIKLFNISNLIANKQYSPIYNTTFDLMSDAQIKAQMDTFISNPLQWLDFDTLGWYPTQTQLEYFERIYTYLVEMGY